MGFASRKAFISLRAANIYKFKIPKPLKLAVAQTVGGSIRYFKFINKAALKLIQCFLRCKCDTICSTLKISLTPAKGRSSAN
ncbi:hypothetical protein DP68_08515 [Clostridium sp. HMP27]|nr:hypothetical protein DP68_08515 [Clostridium sp. HMP27]